MSDVKPAWRLVTFAHNMAGIATWPARHRDSRTNNPRRPHMIPDRDRFLDDNHFRDITGAPQPVDYPADAVALGLHFASYESPLSADFQIFALLATGRPVADVRRRIGEAVGIALARGEEVGSVRVAQDRLHGIVAEYEATYLAAGGADDGEPEPPAGGEPVHVGEELRAIHAVLLEIRDRLPAS